MLQKSLLMKKGEISIHYIRESEMKKKIIAFALVLITVLTWGIVKYRSKAIVPTPPVIWVKASPAKENNFPLTTNAIGTLSARSVDITPEVAGHVQKFNFHDGQWVNLDDILIQLDDAIYKTKYELSKAKLGYSETNFKRTQVLSKRGIVSKQALEQAEADFKEKQANVSDDQVMLNKMQLRAPFAGMVGQRKIHEGNYVNIGQVLVTLTDTKHLHVEYSVPEKYLSLIKLGQPVTITTNAYPNKVFAGKVSFISPTVNPQNRTIALYADIDNDDNALVSGMFVNVQQVLASEERVLVIPARGLMPILEGEQVYKVINGKAIATTVVIGRRFGDNVQILQGLNVNDLVITDGQMKIRNGMSVNLASE